MQLDFFDVPSPCRGVCSADERGYCQGCMRTREERFGWNDFDPNQKQKIIKLCKQREKRKLAKLNVKVVEELNEESSEENVQPSLLDEPPKKTSSDLDFGDFEL